MDGLTDEQRRRIENKRKIALLEAGGRQDDIQFLEDELAASQDQLAKTQDELAFTQENLMKAAQYGQELVSQRDELTAQLTDLEESLRISQVALREAETEQENLRESNHVLTKDRDAVRRTLATFMETSENDELSLQQAQQREEAAKSSTKSSILRIQQLETEIGELKSDMDNLHKENENIKKENANLKTQAEEFRSGKSDLENRVSELTEALQDAEAQKNGHEQELEALERDLNERYENLEKTSSNLHKTLMSRFTKAEARHKEEREHLEAQIEELNNMLQEAQNRANDSIAAEGGETLSSELLGVSSQQQDAAELEKLKQQLQDKCAELEAAVKAHEEAMATAEKAASEKLKLAEAREASLNKRISELDAAVSGSQVEIENLQNTSNEQAAKQLALQSENRDTLSELETAKENLKLVSEQLKELQGKHTQAVEDAANAKRVWEDEQAELENTIAKVRNELQSTTALLEDSEREKAKIESTLQKKLELAEEQKEELATQLENLKSTSSTERAASRKEIDHMSSLARMKDSEIEELKELLRSLREENARLLKKQADLESASNTGAQESAEEVAMLRADLKAATDRLAEAAAKHREAMRKMEDEKAKLQTKVDEQKEDLDDAMESLRAAEEEHAAVTEVLNDDLDELTGELEEMKLSNQKLTEENKKMTSQIATLTEDSKKEKKADARTIAGLVSKLEATNSEKATLTNQLQRVEEKLKKKEALEKELRDRADQLVQEIEQLKTESKGGEARKVAEMISLKENLEKVQEKNRIVQEQMENLEHEKASLECERDILQETVEEAETEKETLTEEVDALLGYQRKLNEENEEYEEKIAFLEREKERAEDSVKLLYSQMAYYQKEEAEGHDASRAQARQEKEIEALRDELTKTKRALGDVTRKRDKLSEEVNQLMDYLSTLNGEANTSNRGSSSQDTSMISSADQDLNVKSMIRSQLNGMQARTEDQRREFETQLADANSRVKKLEDLLMEKNDELGKLKEKVEMFQVDNNELTLMVAELNDNLESQEQDAKGQQGIPALASVSAAVSLDQESESEALKQKNREIQLLKVKLSDAEFDVMQLRVEKKKITNMHHQTQKQLERLRIEYDTMLGSHKPTAGRTRKIMFVDAKQDNKWPWYWGNTPAADASAALKDYLGKNGTFIVRSDSNDPMRCVLLLVHDGEMVEHSLVSERKRAFKINGQTIPFACNTLADAIHFLKKPTKKARFEWNTPLQYYIHRGQLYSLDDNPPTTEATPSASASSQQQQQQQQQGQQQDNPNLKTFEKINLDKWFKKFVQETKPTSTTAKQTPSSTNSSTA